MHNVFIDGRSGTTGLRIEQRLANRRDVNLLVLPAEIRRDQAARVDMHNRADVSFLCLPDEAAKEIVQLVRPETVIIDASTAHRIAPGWAYGMPELGADYRAAIQNGKRIGNPGCHASGFIALVRPLVQAGLIAQDAPLSCVSLTGYTGGGKEIIDKYEAETRTRGDVLCAPMQYALPQEHKHLPEMVAHTGLRHAPVFCPVIADYPCGIELTVPLHGVSRSAVLDCLREFYANAAMINVVDDPDARPASLMDGRDSMEISVHGHDERLLLISRFDNLGKGASGAAVQCLNLAIGADEQEGLVL
ncbi:MAG: N-acetyl-gamma-glutamyl-phosphate reductase [Oscillospiraceae bacterium]|nr:N-acetyl-gamma-glutamyl-phosphate reductase [Oscillospiraceae bacterium]